MDGRIYEVLHGLGKVEAHLTEELDEVRHILRDLPSLSRPRSSTQNYETQQPMPSSPRISVDSLAEALAEEQPMLLETISHNDIETRPEAPKEDDQNKQPASSSIEEVASPLDEEKPMPSPLEITSHDYTRMPLVPPEPVEENQQPVASSSVSIAKEQPIRTPPKPTLHASVEAPLARPTTMSVPGEAISALAPLSLPLLEPPRPTSPNRLSSMLDEAYDIALSRFPHELSEYEKFMAEGRPDGYFDFRRRDPEEIVPMLIKVSHFVIDESLKRLDSRRSRTYWVGRRQQRILNCLC
jgi:hypothetical protein